MAAELGYLSVGVIRPVITPIVFLIDVLYTLGDTKPFWMMAARGILYFSGKKKMGRRKIIERPTNGKQRPTGRIWVFPTRSRLLLSDFVCDDHLSGRLTFQQFPSAPHAPWGWVHSFLFLVAKPRAGCCRSPAIDRSAWLTHFGVDASQSEPTTALIIVVVTIIIRTAAAGGRFSRRCFSSFPKSGHFCFFFSRSRVHNGHMTAFIERKLATFFLVPIWCNWSGWWLRKADLVSRQVSTCYDETLDRRCCELFCGQPVDPIELSVKDLK